MNSNFSRGWAALRSFLMLAGLALFLAGSSLAQTETGQISGVVTDPSGATVPKAKVTVLNATTGAARDTTTDDHGAYAITHLLPSIYTVTVEAPGFSKMEQRIEVTVGSKVDVNFSITVGAAATTVEVIGSAVAQINTETQTLSQAITSKEISEALSLNANPYSFVRIAGNIADSDASPSGTIRSTGSGAGVVINGLRAASTNILLDGAANNDEFTGSLGQQVPLESVQEFSVLTNNFTAEYGRASGGIVNVATKSGGNAYHGSAYEINRLSSYGANDFSNNASGIPKPVYTRNQFGGSAGGPIKKDKIFFFVSPEWTRVRSSGITQAVIPDQNLINASDAATTQAFFKAFGQLRPNDVTITNYSRASNTTLDTACALSPACSAAFPAGSTTTLLRRVQYAVPSDAGGGNPQNTYDYVARVDYNLSSNTQFYARYARFHEEDAVGVVNNSPYSGPNPDGYDSGQTIQGDNALLSLVHSVGVHFTEQSKFVYNRVFLLQSLGTNPVGPTLYWNKNFAPTFDSQLLTFPGYNGFTPGAAIPFGGPQHFYQSYEDMTYVKGKHEFRFGGSYLFFQDNRTFGAYEEAVESLGTSGIKNTPSSTNPLGTNPSLQRLLTGNLLTFTTAIDPQGKFPCGSPGLPAGPPAVTPNCTITLPATQPSFSRSNRYNEFAFYGQDSWKAKQHLTINLGLRWEYYGIQHNKNPLLDSNFYPAAGGSIFQRIRNGDVSLAPLSSVGGLWAKDWNNFAPRVGFAWDIFGNGKTSLRGGYGIGYERNFGNVTFNVIQNVPNYEVVDLLAGTDPGCCTITTSNLGGFSGTGTKTLPRASLRAVNPNIRNAYAHLYDAAIDRELAHNIFLAIEYSGSKGERLYSLDPVNRPGSGNVYLGDACNPAPTPPTVPNCSSRLRGQQYSTINFREGQGISSYNALNIRFNITNAWNSGLNLTTNYTYGHAFDNLSSTFSTSSGNLDLGLLDPFNPHLDRGPADFDIRHRVAISGTWEIPFAKNTHGVLKQAAHGWVVAPIFVAHTGTPFTIYDSTNTQFQELPRLILTSPISRTGSSVPSGAPDTFNYITIPNSAVAEFKNPLTGNSEFGPYPANMTGRNHFRGPGTYYFDFGVHKKFFISERYTAEFRADAFDIFNHANEFFVGGSNDFGSGTAIGSSTVAAQTCKGTCLPSLTNIPQHRNLQLELRFAF